MNRLKRYWMWLLVASGIIACVGCSHHRDRVRVEHQTVYRDTPVYTEPARPSGYTTYRYVYYPEAEVYFEPTRHVYYWHEGSTWRSAPNVPTGVQLRGEVTLDERDPEPWRRHEVIIKKYPRQKHDDDDDHKRHRDKDND